MTQVAPDTARFDPAAVTSLERHVAEVGAGSPSRFVLVLGDDQDAVRHGFDELERRASPRALFVRVADGPGPFEERAYAALVARLAERRGARPGVALLVDPIVQRGAEFVMGPDLGTIQAYLTPEALDEVPAVASRVLVQRFVPAIVQSLSGVKEDLLETLLRERSGSLDGRPGLAEVLGRRPRSEAFSELGELAKRAGCALVLGLGRSLEHVAAPALEVASSLPRAGAFLVLHGAREELWTAEATLLSEEERRRVAGFVVKHTNVVLATEVPVVAPQEKPAVVAHDSRRVPVQIHEAIGPRMGVKPTTRRLVAPAASGAQAATAVAVAAPVTAARKSARMAPVGEATPVRKRASVAKKCAVYGLPFVFVAGLGAFVLREQLPSTARQPVVAIVTTHGSPSAGVTLAPPLSSTRTAIPSPASPNPPRLASDTKKTGGPGPAKKGQAPVVTPPSTPTGSNKAPTLEQLVDYARAIDTARSSAEKIFALDRASWGIPSPDIRLAQVERLLDTTVASSSDGASLRVALVQKLGELRTETRAVDRLIAIAAEPSGLRAERIAAITALRSGVAVAPAARPTVERLAASDADPEIRRTATRAIETSRQP